jgi:hypothetical protein
MDNNQSDHDKINMLVGSFVALEKGQVRIEKSQEDFHKEVNLKLDRVIDNYITRVEHTEVHSEISRIQVVHDTEIKALEKNTADMEAIRKNIDKLQEDTNDSGLIRKLVFSTVSFVLLAVLSAVVYLVIVR